MSRGIKNERSVPTCFALFQIKSLQFQRFILGTLAVSLGFDFYVTNRLTFLLLTVAREFAKKDAHVAKAAQCGICCWADTLTVLPV